MRDQWDPSDDDGQRDATLSLLLTGPKTTSELIAAGIPRAQARIGELRARGHMIIATRIQGSREAQYRWEGRTDPSRVLAGCIIRYTSRDGWTARTHMEAQRAGAIPEGALALAEAAALRAYREVVDEYVDISADLIDPDADDYIDLDVEMA